MKTNEEVGLLQMVKEEGSLMNVVWRRKTNWIGHILRGKSLLSEVIEGRMIGKRPRGRKRLGMLNEFLKESSYAKLKRKAENRKEWRIGEAKNLPNGRKLMMIRINAALTAPLLKLAICC